MLQASTDELCLTTRSHFICIVYGLHRIMEHVPVKVLKGFNPFRGGTLFNIHQYFFDTT